MQLCGRVQRHCELGFSSARHASSPAQCSPAMLPPVKPCMCSHTPSRDWQAQQPPGVAAATKRTGSSTTGSILAVIKDELRVCKETYRRDESLLDDPPGGFDLDSPPGSSMVYLLKARSCCWSSPTTTPAIPACMQLYLCPSCLSLLHCHGAPATANTASIS